MAGVNTCVRGLMQDSGYDALAIIAAALKAAGHDVQMSNKTGEKKTEKQLKRTKKAGKKAARKEMEEKADTEHPEWGMDGDYKYISDKVLREALESGDKPRRKPLTGYMFFLGQVRGELKDEGMKGTEVAKEAGRRWREELNAETKEHYKEQAIDDLETKYGPQSESESEDKKKKPKKTRQPRKKAPARKASSGGGSKEPRKQRKPRKRVATPEPEHEDTPAAPTSGMFDSSDSDNSDEE